MDEDHRAWLLRLLDATERAISGLQRDDPHHRAIIEDLYALRARLAAEVEETGS